MDKKLSLEIEIQSNDSILERNWGSMAHYCGIDETKPEPRKFVCGIILHRYSSNSFKKEI